MSGGTRSGSTESSARPRGGAWKRRFLLLPQLLTAETWLLMLLRSLRGAETLSGASEVLGCYGDGDPGKCRGWGASVKI